MTPCPHGKFDLIVNGQVVAGHRYQTNAHLFLDLQDLMKAIYARVAPFTSSSPARRA